MTTTITATEDLTGPYYPAVPGARTIRDARDLYVGDERVTAEVTGRRVTVFVGLRIVFEGDLPAEITTGREVNSWAAEIALGTQAPAAEERPATGETEADRLRAEARQHEQNAYDSFERCDTDGFLSQWASGRMAGLDYLAADIAEAGGLWEFRGLFDLNGTLVPAVRVQGQWGWSWKLLNERGRCAGWFNESRAKSEERRTAAHAKKGYYVGTVRVAARAELQGSNYFSVSAVAVREDDGWSPDAEIIDNGQ